MDLFDKLLRDSCGDRIERNDNADKEGQNRKVQHRRKESRPKIGAGGDELRGRILDGVTGIVRSDGWGCEIAT